VVRRPDAGSVLESPASTPIEVPVVVTHDLSSAEIVPLEFTASLVSPNGRVSLVSPLSLCTGGEGQSRQHAQRRHPKELTSKEPHSHDLLLPVRRARDRRHFVCNAEPSEEGVNAGKICCVRFAK